MIKRLSLCLALLIILASQALAAVDNRLSEYEERRRTVAALMETATVWVVGEDKKGISQGTGFIVGEGLVATNAHVVDGRNKDVVFYVMNDALSATRAQVVAKIHDSVKGLHGRDFALLRFVPPKGGTLPVLSFNLDVKRMDRVSAWGYPAMVTQFDKSTERLQEGDTRGLKAPPVVYTEGTVNSIVSGKTSATIIHSAQIAGGNSGGPLVNSRGEVVGMNTWGYTEKGEGAFLNAAQLANELVLFLRTHGVNPKLLPGQQVKAYVEPSVAQGRQEKPEPSHRPAKPKPKPDNRIRDVGSFTVEIPKGWSVVEEEEDSILLGSDDDSALVSIMIDDSGGVSLKQTAQELAKEFGGKRPTTDDDGETYSFTFSQDGVDYLAFVGAVEDGRHVLILVGGDMDNQGVKKILDSLTDK